jgi:predicted ArsR family transcriptional regulator
MSPVDLPPPDNSADVLDQPTRRRLFALLAELGGSATTVELAARLDLHPNGVRAHMVRLRDAGLVVRHRVGGPRGRPRDEWAVSPSARPAGEPPQGYGALARWLARTIPATPARLREVEATGREVGREYGAAAAAKPPVRALGETLSALGFQPWIDLHPSGRLSCRLGNCAYREAVRENREVVCRLHRGITLGLLDRVAPAATLARFVPHDPDRAGCEIDVDGVTVATT